MSQIHSGSSSVVHTKRNIPAILRDHEDQIAAKSAYPSYLKSVYRHLNLRLANALESTPIRDDDQVNTTIRRLRYCASVSLIERTDDNATIKKTSGTCKSPFCFICQRIKSKKLQSRLMKVIDDEFFQLCKSSNHDYRFYFLTLTLKHREGDYLKELKEYQNKLFRCKLFKETFGETGIIQAFENVIKPNSYHIHSHNLILSRRIKKSAKDLQKEISEKWKKITGDSFIISFDLIAKGQSIKYDEVVLRKTVKELLKYSTKLRSFGLMQESEKMLLAKWVKSSKGKNFINARGAFRGLGIAANKSFLDPVNKDPEKYDDKARYLLEKTNQIKYTESTLYSEYNLKRKKDELKDVKMIGLSFDSLDVTEFVEELNMALDVNYYSDQPDYIMRELVYQIGELKLRKLDEMEMRKVILKREKEQLKKMIEARSQMLIRFCRRENE